MTNCIFCKIINKEAPATVVFEDDFVIAIKPLHEITQGHTLVIPKQHSENVLDITKEDLEKVSEVGRELGKKLVSDNGATGINLVHSAGKDAEQEVFHFHLHLVPRYPDDTVHLWHH